MTPCEQRERIHSLEKRADAHTKLLEEILDLAKSTDTAIRGDPSRGLTGIVDRQIEHGKRIVSVETRLDEYDQKKWYAQGAIWVVGPVVGVVIWFLNLFSTHGKN
jgi:hypothetical protein